MTDKPYWYLFTVFYCPVCGHEDKYKERVYGKPKPKDYYERHIFKENYDYCQEFASVAYEVGI